MEINNDGVIMFMATLQRWRKMIRDFREGLVGGYLAIPEVNIDWPWSVDKVRDSVLLLLFIYVWDVPAVRQRADVKYPWLALVWVVECKNIGSRKGRKAQERECAKKRCWKWDEERGCFLF